MHARACSLGSIISVSYRFDNNIMLVQATEIIGTAFLGVLIFMCVPSMAGVSKGKTKGQGKGKDTNTERILKMHKS